MDSLSSVDNQIVFFIILDILYANHLGKFLFFYEFLEFVNVIGMWPYGMYLISTH